MEELIDLIKWKELKSKVRDYENLFRLLINVDIITLSTEQNWQKSDEWDINYYVSFNNGDYLYSITKNQYDLLKKLGAEERED